MAAETKPKNEVHEQPIQIPADRISEDALAGIIENFILREGTDYGMVEITYEKKAAQIRELIADGEIVIVFDQLTETVSLLSRREFQKGERTNLC